MQQAEQNLPIDIHINKLLEWLISRRHCNRDWQDNALIIREKINNAIQDMPENEKIKELLSGAYINYFHCLQLVDILKQTEAETKNIFGYYSSQRMKDWQEVVKLYETDNVYLAECAQMLIRNVSYEVPSLKKQVVKLQQQEEEYAKKENDYMKNHNETKNKYAASCKQIGIKGDHIKKELFSLLDELPQIMDHITQEAKHLVNARNYYSAFLQFTLNKPEISDKCLPFLKFIVEKGNLTTYEWKTGEPPEIIEDTKPIIPVDIENGNSEEVGADEIDFGDDLTSNSNSNGDFVHISKNDIDVEGHGISAQSSVELDESAADINWDIETSEITIIDEKQNNDDGKVARGDNALSVLDNPETRNIFLNELLELEGFLCQRLIEMQVSDDALTTSMFQSAPTQVQMQNTESINKMLDMVKSLQDYLSLVKVQHLFMIRNSPKYVDRVVEQLNQKIYLADKYVQCKDAMVVKQKEALEERRLLEPKIKLIVEKTKLLQKQIEDDISEKYKNRVVNIVGGTTTL